jgi:transcriptional regulatory protein LevR
MLSVEKVANIVKSSEHKFSKDFNDDIPFSLSSYINYLRLLHFEKNEQPHFTKEANIFNAGFNTRASYYQWEKRKRKLSLQIDPILDYFQQTQSIKK